MTREHNPTSSARWSDPSVASVIFAPRPQNYTLLSAAMKEPSPEDIAFECLVYPDEAVDREVLESIHIAAIWGQLRKYLRGHFATSLTTKALELPSETVTTEYEKVPARTFPFSSHIDLLTAPVEGLLFDADDFIEH